MRGVKSYRRSSNPPEGTSGGSDAVARQYPTETEMWNSGFVAGRWDILSQFEEPEYYEAKPHKALDHLLRILREYPS